MVESHGKSRSFRRLRGCGARCGLLCSAGLCFWQAGHLPYGEDCGGGVLASMPVENEEWIMKKGWEGLHGAAGCCG